MDKKSIQFIQITPEQLSELISMDISDALIKLQKSIPNPEQLLTREETARLLDVDLSTLWAWTKAGKLKSYGIGSRVFYKRSEIEAALKPLNQ